MILRGLFPIDLPSWPGSSRIHSQEGVRSRLSAPWRSHSPIYMKHIPHFYSQIAVKLFDFLTSLLSALKHLRSWIRKRIFAWLWKKANRKNRSICRLSRTCKQMGAAISVGARHPERPQDRQSCQILFKVYIGSLGKLTIICAKFSNHRAEVPKYDNIVD